MPDPVPQSPRLAARSTQALLSPWSCLGLLLVLLATAATTVLLLEPQRLLAEGGLPERTSGVTAPVLFALAYGLCTAALAPRPVLNLAAGALFGAQAGTLSALAGTVVAAGLSFGLGRLLGQDALRLLLRGRWLASADRQLSRHAFRSVLMMRLVPGVPFALTNYGSAVSRMRWLPFLSATGLGSVPNTGAYAVAGSQAATPTSPTFLLALAFLTLSGAGALVLAWRRRGRLRGSTAEPATDGDRLGGRRPGDPCVPHPTGPFAANASSPAPAAAPHPAAEPGRPAPPAPAPGAGTSTGHPPRRRSATPHRDEHLPPCPGSKR